MSKKNKVKNNQVNEGNLEVQNPPAEQDNTTELSNEKENENMDSKKVRRNVLQFVGDVTKSAGDKLASFKTNHPVGDKVVKIGGSILVVGTTAAAVAAKVLSDKDEEIVDSEAEDVTENDVIDLDQEDDEVEESSEEEETEDEETEETEEA